MDKSTRGKTLFTRIYHTAIVADRESYCESRRAGKRGEKTANRVRLGDERQSYFSFLADRVHRIYASDFLLRFSRSSAATTTLSPTRARIWSRSRGEVLTFHTTLRGLDKRVRTARRKPPFAGCPGDGARPIRCFQLEGRRGTANERGRAREASAERARNAQRHHLLLAPLVYFKFAPFLASLLFSRFFSRLHKQLCASRCRAVFNNTSSSHIREDRFLRVRKMKR